MTPLARLAALVALLASLAALEVYTLGCDACARQGVSDGACGVCL